MRKKLNYAVTFIMTVLLTAGCGSLNKKAGDANVSGNTYGISTPNLSVFTTIKKGSAVR